MSSFKTSSLVHLCMALAIFTTGLLINLIQCLLHFGLKPYNPRLYRYLMKYICYITFAQLVFLIEWWSNSKLEIWMDKEDRKNLGKENALLILNHAYEIDWMFILMLGSHYDILGNCKAYCKKSISYIPCVGWGWKFAEYVFLERSYDKDKENLGRQLETLMSYPEPIWLLLTPEGTRFIPKKQKASVKFAQERGLPVLKHHLIPRIKGFTSSLPSLRNKCVIYDINLAFKTDDPVEPTMRNVLNGYGVKANMFIRRIPFDQVPEDEIEAAEWLQETFREKDRIQESFHTTGSFFKTSGFKETQSVVPPPRIEVFLNYVFWALLSLSLISYYLILSFLSPYWTGLYLALTILIIVYVAMRMSIGMAEFCNASSYGAEIKERNTN